MGRGVLYTNPSTNLFLAPRSTPSTSGGTKDGPTNVCRALFIHTRWCPTHSGAYGRPYSPPPSGTMCQECNDWQETHRHGKERGVCHDYRDPNRRSCERPTFREVKSIKHIVIGVSDYVYERMLSLATASGKSLTDYCRDRLGIGSIERQSSDEFKQRVQSIDRQQLERERDEALEKHPWTYYRTKKWKNGKERRVWVRGFPYPEYDAILAKQPEKAGQYLLLIQEVKASRGQVRLDILKEERLFYRSLKLYKRAVNREVGWVYKVKARKPRSPSGAAPASSLDKNAYEAGSQERV